jgi:hypothetical protein
VSNVISVDGAGKRRFGISLSFEPEILRCKPTRRFPGAAPLISAEFAGIKSSNALGAISLTSYHTSS